MGTNFEIDQDGTIKFNKAMPNIGADDNGLTNDILTIFKSSELDNTASSAFKARKKAIAMARNKCHQANAEQFADAIALRECPGVITRSNLYNKLRWRRLLIPIFLLPAIFCLMLCYGRLIALSENSEYIHQLYRSIDEAGYEIIDYGGCSRVEPSNHTKSEPTAIVAFGSWYDADSASAALNNEFNLTHQHQSQLTALGCIFIILFGTAIIFSILSLRLSKRIKNTPYWSAEVKKE